MTRKNLSYIGLLLSAMFATACSDDIVDGGGTLSGDGNKTPLDVTALLDVSHSTKTRAADKDFVSGDKLLAYMRHVTWASEDANTARVPVTADQAPRLVTFKCTGSEAWNSSIDDILPFKNENISINSSNTKQATGLTASYTNTASGTTNALYWDDFSNSGTSDTDLRTDKHYLQSFYGYCFNGGEGTDNSQGLVVKGNITTVLNQTEGTLGWKVDADQSSDNTTDANAFQHSDLLWSAEQIPVRYDHSNANAAGDHGKLILPYTHAMSKVTINITIDYSFTESNVLTNTKVELNDMFTTCICTAPTATLSEYGDANAIKMKKETPTADNKASYTAIVVPSILTLGNTFASVTAVGNDSYRIPVTAAMLAEAAPANNNLGWGKELVDADDEYISNGSAQSRADIGKGTGKQMKSGVHYVLNVTISKAGVSVIALIKDWVQVEAEGVGQIHFNADVRVLDKFNNITNNGAQFNLWRLIATDDNKTGRTTTSYGSKATTITYDNDNDEDETEDTWVCDPKIYWQDFTTSYYFRALGKWEDGNYKAVDSFDAAQGTDLVWGTTAEHKGYEASGVEHPYAAGAAINPRTGNVPLAFEHSLTKITVNLQTNEGSAINLAGAKLALLYNYDKATISLEDGTLSDRDYKNKTDHYSVKDLAAANASGEGAKMKDYIVIPQDLTTYFDGTEWKERKSAITYYTAEELEEVDGKTYDRKTLTVVPYTEEEIKEHNNSLPNAKKVGDVKTPAVLFTYSEYSGRSSYDYKPDQSSYLPISESDYALIPDGEKTMPAVNYTQAEIDAAKAIVGAQDYTQGSDLVSETTASKNAGDVKTAAYVITYTQYTQQKYHLPLSQDTYNKLSDASKTKTPAVLFQTENEVTAYNATLDGAWNLHTIKEYKVNANSKIATTDTPKDNSGPDNLIKLVITLNDGNNSTYSLDMSQCIEENTRQKITQWEPGKHYVYTINLNSESITFRALIKDWVDSTGSGEATLDW